MFIKRFVTRSIATSVALLLTGIALARPALADNPRRYSIKDLGTLGGTGSTTESVNDSGVAVGYSYTDKFLTEGTNQIRRAFIWDKVNGMRALGSLGGDGTQDDASAINNAGTVVGYAAIAPDISGKSYLHAFIYDSAGGMRDLTPGKAYNSKATALNDNGDIVGGAEIGTPDATTGVPAEHAVKWDSKGVMTDLGTLGGSTSEARGINNAGTVIGFGLLSTKNAGGGYDRHSFVWDSASGIKDIGVPPITIAGNERFTFVTANSINNKGEAVGFCTIALDNFSSVQFSFIWDSKNGIRSLHDAFGISFGAQAFVNNDGGLIGGGGYGSGVLYDPAIGVIDLSKAAGTKGPGVTYAPRTVAALSSSGLAGGEVLVSADDGSSNAFHAFLTRNNPVPTMLAADVTSRVRIKRGGYRLSLLKNAVEQRVTITNTSHKAIVGPLSFVVASTGFASLSYGAAQDYVNWHSPLFTPYVDLGVSESSSLMPGKSVSITLRFAPDFDPNTGNPIFTGIVYTGSVLAGPGAR